jgi:Fe-S-cluster containining protein
VGASAAWVNHPARVELRRLFDEADALVSGATCTCAAAARAEDARCCQFGVTGREPYLTPTELCEVRHAQRALGTPPRPAPRRGRLPLATGACPLLSPEGRCTIYASRPFGCRTFFCQGHEPPRRAHAREAIQEIGRRIADLAARYFPRDPLPRPLTRALSGPDVPAPALPLPSRR